MRAHVSQLCLGSLQRERSLGKLPLLIWSGISLTLQLKTAWAFSTLVKVHAKLLQGYRIVGRRRNLA
jgi:hypothetical protein